MKKLRTTALSLALLTLFTHAGISADYATIEGANLILYKSVVTRHDSWSHIHVFIHAPSSGGPEQATTPTVLYNNVAAIPNTFPTDYLHEGKTSKTVTGIGTHRYEIGVLVTPGLGYRDYFSTPRVDVIPVPAYWWASYPKTAPFEDIVNYPAQALTWVSTGWMGDIGINVKADINWIFVPVMNEWLFTNAPSLSDVWLYSPSRGDWIWTNPSEFPWVWLMTSQTWENVSSGQSLSSTSTTSPTSTLSADSYGTPSSSRQAPADHYAPGSMDKTTAQSY